MLFPCMVLGSPAVRHLVLLKASLRMHNLAIVPSTKSAQIQTSRRWPPTLPILEHNAS